MFRTGTHNAISKTKKLLLLLVKNTYRCYLVYSVLIPTCSGRTILQKRDKYVTTVFKWIPTAFQFCRDIGVIIDAM